MNCRIPKPHSLLLALFSIFPAILTTSQAATLRVPLDYPSITAAVPAAFSGDTILVSPGTYTESIVVDGKSLLIRSTDGPLQTTITNSPSINLVTFRGTAASGSTLEGFRLQGGSVGILCENSGPTIRRNILVGQQIGNWGAISLGGNGYATVGTSPAVIVNNTIVNCVNGGISTFSSQAPIIKNNIITFNGHYGIHREGGMPGVAQPLLSYNDVFGNPVAYQEIADPGVGTIAADPRLSSQQKLLVGSPCISAGDPDTVYNDPDGSRNDMGAVPYDGPPPPPLKDTLFVPQDVSTIQEAVNGVVNGGVVLVSPGTYTESIVIQGKSVTIRSTSGPLQTTITNSPNINLVTFNGTATSGSVLEGFKLQGGYIGVLCQNSGPIIRRNILVGQQIPNWGAISLGGNGYGTVGTSPAVIVNNTIVNCVNGGISTFSSQAPTMKNNIIAFNGHYGIHREGLLEGVAQPFLSYNDIFGNPVSYQEIADSGVGTIAANPKLSPQKSLLAGSPCINAGDPDTVYNDPDGSRNDMGAVPFDSAAQPPLADTLYVPQDSSTIQGAVYGVKDGGVVLVSPGTYAEGVIIEWKSVTIRSTDGPLQTTITNSPSINLVTFRGMAASGSVLDGFKLEGGYIGVLCENAGPSIQRNILVGQQIGNWGAISLGGFGYATLGTSPAVIVNNTIVNCVNGGISTFSTEAPTIKNNIIAFNGHYGIHREGGMPGVAQPLLSYNDVYGNPVSYQEIANAGVGTIAANPKLSSEYTLLAGSPCINAGDPDMVYNDPDGTRNDMGAVPSVACRATKGDMNADGSLSGTDVVLMLMCVFVGTGNCDLCFTDVTCNGVLTNSDVVVLLNAVFSGEPICALLRVSE